MYFRSSKADLQCCQNQKGGCGEVGICRSNAGEYFSDETLSFKRAATTLGWLTRSLVAFPVQDLTLPGTVGNRFASCTAL